MTNETRARDGEQQARTLTGWDAIEHAEATGRLLRTYADAEGEARDEVGPLEARRIALEDPSLVHIEIGVPDRIELHEDNGGTLWFVVDAEGIAVEMPRDGDFLADARTYRDSWAPEDTPHALYALDATPVGVSVGGAPRQSQHVATYHAANGRLELHVEPGSMWAASREYLRASLEGEEVAP